MALSFCSNWEAAASPHFNPHSDEVADALFGFLDPANSPLFPLDPIFSTIQYDESNLFYSSPSPPSAAANTDTNSLLLPSLSESSMLSLPPPPYDNCFMYHYPKRHCSCSDFDSTPPPPLQPQFDPGSFVLPFEAPLPPVKAEAEAGSGSLSSQSVAARERRRRISEKMRELCRLIPGGSRMNTAEMLQAAHSYVRFLQAQVGMLSLMGSSQVSRDAENCNNLKLLVASPVIQERLSSAGRCLVTEEVVDGLAADVEIRSSPLISRDLDRFVSSIREMRKGDK